jgi:integrase
MSPRIDLFLVLAHETGHRAASIRKLRWSDVDLERKTVLWRGEYDKIGYQHVTPLTDEAVAVLAKERSRAKAIGDAWVFPSLRKPGQCLSGDAAYHLWKRLAARAGLPKGERMGWHSLRRKFATELKATPLKDLCALGGWKEPTTLLTCYIRPDEATQRQALAQRRSLGAAGIS